MGSSLIHVWLFFWLDSQALCEVVALPTQEINFFTCLWSFILRTVTLWMKAGIIDVKDNFHLTSCNLWSSVTVRQSLPQSLWVPQSCSTNTQHPWMNTCIELTMAVYMHRGCNFAALEPKCKTDFLPWLHHSAWCRQNKISEARVKFLRNQLLQQLQLNRSKQQMFYLLTALRLQIPSFCQGVLEVMKWNIWYRSWDTTALQPRKQLFSCSVWPNTWQTCALIKYMHGNGWEKSHQRAWQLLDVIKSVTNHFTALLF